jgi:demethylmenaquinone methyltransferase / 2-methoxy-6-polyprenyl-1,4-benzoquinol methylase
MSQEIKNMFAGISNRYDLMNDILSLGIHRLWRRTLMKNIKMGKVSKVLDCATGTGDLAFALKKYYGNNTRVTGTDFCTEMLDIAIEKSKKNMLDVEFKYADVCDLYFKDSEFDLATISFGIRNVDNLTKGISEMARIVCNGGIVAILEFGQPKGIFRRFYDIYSKKVMPKIGKIFAKSENAYTYLPQTASDFPCREKFIEIMNSTGCFKKTYYKSLSCGIAYIYFGEVRK